MAELNAPVRSALTDPAYADSRTDWWPHAGVVSWGAVFAGAVAAAAFGLILLTLGTGLGLAALSPWRSASASATTFGVAAVIWVCVTQILTSGLGGYLAGRLRHRWPLVETDEVYFRDTAHGFLSWAVATLATAALVAAMLPTAERAGVRAAAHAAVSSPVADRGDANAAVNHWPIGYYVDALFRQPAGSSAVASATPDAPSPSANAASGSEAAAGVASAPTATSASHASAPASAPVSVGAGGNTASGAVVSPVATPAVPATATEESTATATGPAAAGMPPKGEVTRIFLNSLATGDSLSATDAEYVARIVSRYTGLSPQAALARVNADYAQLQQKVGAIESAAKSTADAARRASVSASLWLFISLLMGAFSASFMAIFGGRLRDI
jgi:hypothetical protein